ncbi:MAG: patatin-like phospholipase family protein [Thermoanaerobaculia bacterium]
MTSPRRALVLGGGGILEAAYEVGALTALEEWLGVGRIAHDFEIFLGTSAGSFVAALAARVTSSKETSKRSITRWFPPQSSRCRLSPRWG